MKGNVIDMAVGIIIGAAFGKIVSSFVGDIVMPMLGMAIGGMNFTDLSLSLGPNPAGEPVLVKYGAFIQAVFDFVIIALAIFMAIKGINRLKKPPSAAPAAAPAGRGCRTPHRDPGSAEAAGLISHASAANASRVRFSGSSVRARDVVLDTDSAPGREPLDRGPADMRAGCPRARRLEQQLYEIDARLDRNHEAGLEPARKPQIWMALRLRDLASGHVGCEASDVVDLQAEQVATPCGRRRCSRLPRRRIRVQEITPASRSSSPTGGARPVHLAIVPTGRIPSQSLRAGRRHLDGARTPSPPK